MQKIQNDSEQFMNKPVLLSSFTKAIGHCLITVGT